MVPKDQFTSLLRVDAVTGAVFLEQPLDRNSVATITLAVEVTDPSAEPPQVGIVMRHCVI